MMYPISIISPAATMRTSHTGTTRTSAHGQRGVKISEEQFLPLLTAQIKHHNTLKSVDSSDSVSQPAALSELPAFQDTDSTQEQCPSNLNTGVDIISRGGCGVVAPSATTSPLKGVEHAWQYTAVSNRIPSSAETETETSTSEQFLTLLTAQIKSQQLHESKSSFDSASQLAAPSRLSIYHDTGRAPKQCHSNLGSGIFDASWVNCDTIALQATTSPLEERDAEQFLKGGKCDADVIFLAAEETNQNTPPIREPAALDQKLAWEAFMDDVYYPDPVSISINLSAHAWAIGVWISVYNPALPKRTGTKSKRRSSASRLTEYWISSRHDSLEKEELSAGLAANQE